MRGGGSSEEEELIGQLEVVLAVERLAHQEGQAVSVVTRGRHTYCRLRGTPVRQAEDMVFTSLGKRNTNTANQKDRDSIPDAQRKFTET